MSATRMMRSATARSLGEAQVLRSALEERLAACRLVLHPEKAKIVYCEDANRHGDFPDTSFVVLGYEFKERTTLWRRGEKRKLVRSFQPAASLKALTRIGREIRSWALHRAGPPAQAGGGSTAV